MMKSFIQMRMPQPLAHRIFSIAESQHGYFTSAQAMAEGLRQNAITLMARRGTIERVSRGVYRMANYPESPLGQYMEAALWPQAGIKAVISHQSALAFHGLSDVSPAKVHITVTPDHRVRRATPAYLVIHTAELEDQDVQVLNGIPVTTPVRSILDCHAAHIGRALIRQAIEDGRANGKLIARDVALLDSLIGNEETMPPTPSAASTSSSSSSLPPSLPSPPTTGTAVAATTARTPTGATAPGEPSSKNTAG